jgi:hypothetical protein
MSRAEKQLKRQTETPALGVHLVDSILRAGAASPVDVDATADVLNRAIRRCAHEAVAEVAKANGTSLCIGPPSKTPASS